MNTIPLRFTKYSDSFPELDGHSMHH